MDKKKCFECKNSTDFGTESYHLLFPTIASGRVSPLVEAFMPFNHVIDWPPRTILQLLPSSKNSLQGGIHSVSPHKTCLARLAYSDLVSALNT